MLIHNKLTKKSVYFIHIPRTGGRYIREIFRNDKNYSLYFFHSDEYYKNKQIAHLTYPDYLNLTDSFIDYNGLNLNIKNIPHFTIVRNPFDKFKSEMKSYIETEHDINQIQNSTERDLIDLIEEIINDNSNNWFVPQSSFISPQTKIWKYEDGFGDEFVTWIQNNFDIHIKNLNVEYEKDWYDHNKIDLTSLLTIKPLIEKIYRNDYINFGYELQFS